MGCCYKEELYFLYIFVIVIISWIIIDLWGHVINNLFYETIGLNPKSTYHTLIVALLITSVFIVILIYLDDDGKKIKKNITGIEPPSTKKIVDII